MREGRAIRMDNAELVANSESRTDEKLANLKDEMIELMFR